VLGVLAQWAGEGEQALALAEQAVAVAHEVDDRGRVVLALLGCADALWLLGRHAEARATFEDCRSRAAAFADSTVLDCAAALALLARQAGRSDDALRWLETIEQHLAGGGALDDTETLTLQWRCLQAAQGLDEAAAARWLARAQHDIEATTAQLADDPALQHRYRSEHPVVRALLQALEQAQRSASS
jgi:Tetratricopeptide repeat